MHKLTIIFPLLCLALLLASCEKTTVSPTPLSANQPTPQFRLERAPDRIPPIIQRLIDDLEQEEQSNPGCRPLRRPAPYLNESFTMNRMIMNDGCLEINYSHSGGCATHLFALTWNGIHGNEVTLKLHHYANGDLCEAWVTDSKLWDLTALQDPGRTSGTLTVTVIGWNGQSMSFPYTY